MEKEIYLYDYEIMSYSQEDECAKAAELLGLSPDSSEEEIKEYIIAHHEWRHNYKEYQYMGYDCGDCYMGGDEKRGIVCGDYLVVYAESPFRKVLEIYKKK